MKIVIEKKWSDKRKRSIDCNNPKGFSEKAHCAGRKKNEGKDPKKGTGKKPKGSGRRLYTDENPRDTVRIKFATPADARRTVSKVRRISKPFARKIQILTVMEQRAKVMGKSKVVAIAKKGKDSIRRSRRA